MTTEAQVPVLDIEPSSAPQTPKTTKVARKRAPKRLAKAVAAPEQASTLEVVVLEDTPASTSILTPAKKRSRFARLVDYCFRRRGAKRRDAQRNAAPVEEAVAS